MSLRKFGPKSADHPSVGKPCSLCRIPFAEGDFTTLIELGPDPDDAEAVRAYLLGNDYNAMAVEIHFDCVQSLPAIRDFFES